MPFFVWNLIGCQFTSIIISSYFSVVYHHGKTSTGGHYTTSVFHPGINGWVHSDDSNVKTVLVRDVLKYVPQRVPYLLYYRRLDSH